MFSNGEIISHPGNDSCLAYMSDSAELQLSRATSQDHDEEIQHVSKSKIQVKLENRAQQSGKSGVANSKIKRPASPYHISSVAFHQKDGGKGFIDLNQHEQQKPEEDDDNHFKSSDLRAQWFLSTNQWQGFMPLQISATEPLSDTNNQAHVSDELTDPNEFSSAVSESLKKMKENHSLFYKIACDISISDSDITKNDEQPSKPEEEEELVISEYEPTRDVAGIPSDQKSNDSNLPVDRNSWIVDDETQNSTHKMQNEVLVNSTCDCGETTTEESEDKSEKILKTLHKAGDPNRNTDQTPVDNSKTKEKRCLKKKLEDLKEDQEKQEEWEKCASLRNENNTNEQDQGNKLSVIRSNTTYEVGDLIRSASFGKPRVTVIRTSL